MQVTSLGTQQGSGKQKMSGMTAMRADPKVSSSTQDGKDDSSSSSSSSRYAVSDHDRSRKRFDCDSSTSMKRGQWCESGGTSRSISYMVLDYSSTSTSRTTVAIAASAGTGKELRHRTYSSK